MYSFFFFNDTATTEIYTLSLHDALPIFLDAVLGEDPLRFIEPRAHGRGHQAVLGHRVADRAVQFALELQVAVGDDAQDRKSPRLNSSHSQISYAVFCLKKKINHNNSTLP